MEWHPLGGRDLLTLLADGEPDELLEEPFAEALLLNWTAWTPLVNAYETYPTACGSLLTPCWTSPFDALAATKAPWFVPPRKMFLNASCVPDVVARPIGSMVPPIGPIPLQLVIVGPTNMPLIWADVRLPTWLALLVIMQIASRAILVNTRPPGSEPGTGSREEAPIETRPLETSEMPTLDPPWRIRKLYFLPFLVLCQAWASFVSSGKTEVDPLIEITFAALADAGTIAQSASAAMTDTVRSFLVDTMLLSICHKRGRRQCRAGAVPGCNQPVTAL